MTNILDLSRKCQSRIISKVCQLQRRIIRRSSVAWVVQIVQWCLLTLGMLANKGVCSVEIATSEVGFFAQLSWCLEIFQYCDDHGLVPDIHLTGEIYLDSCRGSNWLYHFFDVNRPVASEEIARQVRFTYKLYKPERWDPPFRGPMSLADGSRLVQKYLRPKQHICKMVDEFWLSRDIDGLVVGVHFRGTDKFWEAPRVSWQHCLNVLQEYVRTHSTTQAIFVSSDEQLFIDFIKNSVRQVPVYYRTDHYRSNDGRPVHKETTEVSGYERGEDALVNALLLAKCAILIRTTSFLSAWASILNPNLKVILLNKPYDGMLWYPESKILEKPDTEYVPMNCTAVDRLT